MSQERKPENRAAVEEFRGEKSRKLLKCSEEATTHMKQYVIGLRERAAQGEPVVFNWGAPLELLNSMDVLHIQSVYYSALLSAKQLSRYYLDVLNSEGYFRDLCRYCTVPLGYAFDHKPEIAPWGGLPKLTAAVIERQDDPLDKIWEVYAREFNIPLYFIEYTYPTRVPANEHWWEDQRGADAEVESYQVDLKFEEYEGLIRFLEAVTGRHFNQTRLRRAMERTNEMSEYFWKATDLAGGTVPFPIGLADGLANVPAFLWFRGTQWGVEQGRRYYEEIKQRVDRSEAACKNERVRLQWRGIPQWFSLGLFNAFEENYGAVFAPSQYLDQAERMIRRDLSDPLRALASRETYFFLDRIIPTTASRFRLYCGKKFKVHGAIFGVAESCKLNYCNVIFNRMAYEKAGIPTIEIVSDMVDARDWDDTKMKSLISSFIESLTS